MKCIKVTKSRSTESTKIRKTDTTDTNNTNRTSVTRRSRGGNATSLVRQSTNALQVERALLRNAPDRSVLYEEVTKNYSTHGLAVIFILRIKPRFPVSRRNLAADAMISAKTLGTTATAQTTATATSRHCDPLEELEIIQSARTLFERSELFTEGKSYNGGKRKEGRFELVKYDDKRVFCICSDPVTAMKKMMYVRKFVKDHFASHPTAYVDVSGGCELGMIFELEEDYYGDPINVASKLGEDTAQAGEMMVSFGGKEEFYIKKMKSEADFIKGKVEVSKVEIEFYFMEEKPHKASFLEKICCLTLDEQNSPVAGGARVGPASSAAVQPRSSLAIPTTTVAPSEQAAYDLDGNKDGDIAKNSSMLAGIEIKATNGVSHFPSEQESIEVQKFPSLAIESPAPTPDGMDWEEIVMLQSDLSGFTRLTKKYGILHFMTLILQCRRIFNKYLAKYGGEVIKYDGDNIICKFCANDTMFTANETERAIQYILEVRADLDEYNSGREEDFQIRAKIGMAKGAVIVTDDGDIVGDAWEDCCELSEDTAKVGEILITEAIKADLETVDVQFDCEFEARMPEEEEEEEGGMGVYYNLTLKM